MRLKFLPSFVKRKGRITKNQEENLRYLSDFSIKSLKQIKKEASTFSYCCLEIGFGNAEHLKSQALDNPDILFIGSEVYMSGIGTLIGAIKKQNIDNIRIFPDDIRILLDEVINDLQKNISNKITFRLSYDNDNYQKIVSGQRSFLYQGEKLLYIQ